MGTKSPTLPRDVLFLILDKLLDPIDHLRFAAVRKDWYFSAKDYNGDCTVFPPLLMIPTRSKGNGTTKHKGKLYNVFEAKFYNNIELPMRNHSHKNLQLYYCGCGHGWLAKVVSRDALRVRITLMNPFRTGEGICLPYFNRGWQFVKKVILSADPISNSDNYVVIAFPGAICHDQIAVIKGGQKNWTRIRLRPVLFTDAIFYNQYQVYLVDSYGYILSLDVNNPNSVPQFVARLPQSSHGCVKAYLLKSTNGDLLHVRRFRSENGQTNRFKVYNLVYEERYDGFNPESEEVEVKNIGDEALFVGDNQSMSILASKFPGCQPNSIYFNSIDDGRVLCDIAIGIFNLVNGITTQYYPQNSLAQHAQRSLWITPPCVRWTLPASTSS